MQKNKNSKPYSKNKNSKYNSLFIWSSLLITLLVLNSLAIKNDNVVKLSMSKFIELAKANLIKSAEIQSIGTGGPQWYHVNGKFKNDAASIASILEKTHINFSTKKLNSSKNMAIVFPEHFNAGGRLTESRFNELTNGTLELIITEKPEGTVLSSILTSTLPFLVILFFLYFLFIRQIRAVGKGGAMGFGKSRLRLLQENNKKITFKDVAGCDEAKEEVKEIVEFLKNPKKFQDIGGRIPKGCLMVGAPGTGKTLLAKAVAGEANVPFFSISGSDFVEMFVGVGASRVRDMFEQAKQSCPCVVFIDEIDAVGRKRGTGLGGGNDEREQTLNALLVEMDGFESHDGIIVVAATNRPDILDNALLRPGRFDRQIVIDLPDLNGRKEILKVHSSKVKLSHDVNLETVARNTSGYSGAELENLLNEAALLAAKESKKQIDTIDLEVARDKISFGTEHKKLMDDNDKKITAYHESGHAIIQVLLDDGLLPVHKVTIIPRGNSLGSTMMIPSKDILNYSKKHLFNQICCSMGGRVAEELIFNEQSTGALADIKSATNIANKMVKEFGMCDSIGPAFFGNKQDGEFFTKEKDYSERTAQQIDDSVLAILNGEYKRAKRLLQANRDKLEILAKTLLKHETIKGSDVEKIVKTGAVIDKGSDDTQQNGRKNITKNFVKKATSKKQSKSINAGK